MSDQKSKVKSYVRRRLESWQHEPNPHQIRADLANLRRGIGKAPGDLPELWGLLFRDFPEELMSSTGEPTWAEWAVSGALTLYALHQQGAQRSMHVDGQRLGMAICKLAGNDTAQSSAAEIQCLCHCAEHAGVPAPPAWTDPASEKRGHPAGLCGAGRRFV